MKAAGTRTAAQGHAGGRRQLAWGRGGGAGGRTASGQRVPVSARTWSGEGGVESAKRRSKLRCDFEPLDRIFALDLRLRSRSSPSGEWTGSCVLLAGAASVAWVRVPKTGLASR